MRIKEYPYEPKQTEITIGRKEKNLFFYLDQMLKGSKDYMNNTATNGSYQTGSLFGSVSSNHNPIKSDNDLLKIKGDLLTISDNDNIRVRLGNYNGEFVFIIYDKNKKEAIFLNENGDAVFAGSIDTGEDCRIQGELRVGLKGDNDKGISFYGTSYVPDEEGNYSTPYARLVPYVANNEDFKGINVTGGKFCVDESPVATNKDIEILQQQINLLKKRLDELS